MTTERDGHLRITVAACTRGRPGMLSRLLASWGAMALPDGAEVRCLVVENDEAPRSARLVDEVAPLPNGLIVDHVHEPELGIPFARNRAAREAIGRGADLLAFVDDDEVVAQDWLVRLVAGYRASRAVLIGAPLRVLPQRAETAPRRLMHRAVSRRYAAKEARAARRAGLAGTPGVTIVTNNWLAETALFHDHGIWFDEGMRFTGGTDAKFTAEVKARGLPTAWVADAIAYEEVPPERLSFAYQFARGRDQSATHFHRKILSRPTMRLSVLVSVPLKALSVMGLTMALPFTRGETILGIARQSGWIAGRLTALAGRRSDLYGNVTGD